MATIWVGEDDTTYFGKVDNYGNIVNRYDKWVGTVSAGGGVANKDGPVGRVSSSGQVTDPGGFTVGSVSGTTVRDHNYSRVGSVRAEINTYNVTGVTEVHKAGAALLLVLLETNAGRSPAPSGSVADFSEPAPRPVSSVSCPRCHKKDKTRKVSAIVSGGPITKPGQESALGCAAALGVVVLTIILSIFSHGIIATPVALLIVLAWISWQVYVLAKHHTEKRRVEKFAKAELEMTPIWDDLYYCYRDDTVFRDSLPLKFAQSSNMAKLLADGS